MIEFIPNLIKMKPGDVVRRMGIINDIYSRYGICIDKSTIVTTRYDGYIPLIVSIPIDMFAEYEIQNKDSKDYERQIIIQEAQQGINTYWHYGWFAYLDFSKHCLNESILNDPFHDTELFMLGSSVVANIAFMGIYTWYFGRNQ